MLTSALWIPVEPQERICNDNPHHSADSFGHYSCFSLCNRIIRTIFICQYYMTLDDLFIVRLFNNLSYVIFDQTFHFQQDGFLLFIFLYIRHCFLDRNFSSPCKICREHRQFLCEKHHPLTHLPFDFSRYVISRREIFSLIVRYSLRGHLGFRP